MGQQFDYVKSAAPGAAETKAPAAAPDVAVTTRPAAAPGAVEAMTPEAAPAVNSSHFLDGNWPRGKRSASKRRRLSPDHSTSTLAAPQGKVDVGGELFSAAEILMIMSKDSWHRPSSEPITVEPPDLTSSHGGQDDVVRRSPSIPPSPPASRPSYDSSESVPEPTVASPASASELDPESLPVPAGSAGSQLVPATPPETMLVPATSTVTKPLSTTSATSVAPATAPAPAPVPPHVPNPIAAAAAAPHPPTLSQARNLSAVSHACSKCNKVFSSYQALGGHMTSHRNPASHGNEQALGSALAAGPAASGGRVHQCKICSRTFDTGQALGGHMRLHYDPSAGAGHCALADASGAPATTKTDMKSSSVKRAILVDLNVDLPAAMDVDGESLAMAPATSAYEEPPPSNVECPRSGS